MNRPKVGSKDLTYNSQPFLLASGAQTKIGIYNNAEIKTNIGTIDREINQIIAGFGGTKVVKRPSSSSRKRRRPKSYKKKKTLNFLDNYVTEQYNEYKRKESYNNIIKHKLYKEMGMPPLPIHEKKQSTIDDTRNHNSKEKTTQNTSDL